MLVEGAGGVYFGYFFDMDILAVKPITTDQPTSIFHTAIIWTLQQFR